MIAQFILYIFQQITIVLVGLLNLEIPQGVLFNSTGIKIYWIVFVVFVARLIIWLYNKRLKGDER